MAAMYRAACLILPLLSLVYGQVLIPRRKVGFVYNNGSFAAPVWLDVFLGPICKDSRQAFPTLLKVADFYGPGCVRLAVHLFPLPYHRNAYLAAMGAHAIKNLTDEMFVFHWITDIYDNMENLTDDATYHMSERDVIKLLTEIAETYEIEAKHFVDQMNDKKVSLAAKVEWKYTCTRGISYAPAFMLNDVIIGARQTWTLDDWREQIDPFLEPREEEPLDNTLLDDSAQTLKGFRPSVGDKGSPSKQKQQSKSTQANQ